MGGKRPEQLYLQGELSGVFAGKNNRRELIALGDARGVSANRSKTRLDGLQINADSKSIFSSRQKKLIQEPFLQFFRIRLFRLSWHGGKRCLTPQGWHCFPLSRKKQAGRCRRSGGQPLRVPADRSEGASLRGARPLHAAKQPLELRARIERSTRVCACARAFSFLYIVFLFSGKN